MRNKLAFLIIIIGLLIALFPIADRIYTWYWQNKALQSYEELNVILAEEQSDNTESTNEINDEEPQAQEQYQENSGEDAQETAQYTIQPIGILEIEKINVNLPILEGATQKNLKVGVGWIKETTKLGEVGNTALAAHRSHTYGRLFNRLDELEIDDEIIVISDGTEYRYKVYQKLVVEPTDTSVLSRNNKDRIITLITCTPMKDPTHRLIIKGKIKDK